MTAITVDPLTTQNIQSTRSKNVERAISDQGRRESESQTDSFLKSGAYSSQLRAATSDNGISIAVDPVALITTECITVTSAMRKHARWAQSSVSAILGGGGALDSGRTNPVPEHLKRGSTHSKAGTQPSRPSKQYLTEDDGLASRWGLRGKRGRSMQDNPLMSAFARLRSDLRGCTSRFNFPSTSGLPILQYTRYPIL